MTETEPNFPIQSALVSGASGFIGGRLCQLLKAQDVDVCALLRQPAAGAWDRHQLMDLALDMPTAETLAGVDTVFHLAGKAHAISESHADETEYFRINTEGTRRLLTAAVSAGVRRFVLFSTVKVMGDDPIHCQDEDSPCTPDTAYGRSKLEAERLVLQTALTEGLHTAVLRMPLVYGPGVKGNLAAMLHAVRRHRFPPLKVSNKRSLVFVDDVARAAIKIALSRKAAGQVYIVTDGAPYSTTTLYELMCKATGQDVPSWHVPIWGLRMAAGLGDLYRLVVRRRFAIDSPALSRLTDSAWYSSAKIERELCYRPTARLEQTLPEMVRHALPSRR